MRNYKIRVNGEVENKEAQELFLKYGATGNMCLDQSIRYVCTFNGALTQYDFLPSIEFKRITLPELRDMVVLKRNDVGDATHKGSITDNVYYVSSDEEVYRFESSTWCFSTAIVADLKQIEKKEMKEYLDKQQDGTYKLIKASSGCIDRDWIEIPEGAESFNYFGNEGNVFFLKNNSEITLYSNETEDWAWQDWGDIDFDGVVCLWSRHTLPEELPFIDDEPSLNDQYAEIEKVRQSAWQKQEGGNHYKNLKIQPMQYALENKLDYAQANVVKYVTRHKEKNGKEDLLKAIHNIELMIEFYYGDEK